MWIKLSSSFVLTNRIRACKTNIAPQSLYSTRRDILLTGILAPLPAFADDEKIVLQTFSPILSPESKIGLDLIDLDPELRRIAVFERAAPSVVFIDTFVDQRDAFSNNVMEVPLGAGSGFVWDAKGHIVTNYHVVRNAKTAQVAILTKTEALKNNSTSIRRKKSPPARVVAQKLAAEAKTNPSSSIDPGLDDPITNYRRAVYKARVVGVDPGKDIAILKVDAPAEDLQPIIVGTSTGIRVGQQALAIGNPFGLDHTLTAGIISGIGREVRSPSGRPISNVIQTDAAINPGNSGGPLLDNFGRLIGMNTAIYSPSGGSAGIGFAIPVDIVKFIVDTLIRDGRVIRAVLGISYLESKQAVTLGIQKGVLVLDVPADSPAKQAGLRGTKRTESGLIEIGDIIIGIDQNTINTEADLFMALEKYKPLDTITLTVQRVDQQKMKDVKIVTKLKAMSDSVMTKIE